MCVKGEWINLQQKLMSFNKDNPLPNISDKETGETPLMIACKENRIMIIETLLQLGVNVNEKSKTGKTALHFAAHFASENIVKLLLLMRADPNATENTTHLLPIHLACSRSKSSTEIVHALLNATNNGRLQEDKEGFISLVHAVEVGSISVIKELLKFDADLQLKIKNRFSGDTALHVACQKKNPEVVQILCEFNAPIDVQNNSGKTALHYCVENNNEINLKLLHTYNANADITDDMDQTALHLAAKKGYKSIVEFLVDKFNCNVLTRDKDGNTLMHVTSIYGHGKTTLSLLQRGALLHMPNKTGSVCLHAAAQGGHVNVIKSLLDNGSNINAKTKDLYTPLHIAVQYGNPAAVETLLSYGANVNSKGGVLDESPLHIAARAKNGNKCAEMLLKSGADVNLRSKKGETAMQITARNGNIEICHLLMNNGADPGIVCIDGNSALHVAVRFSNYQVLLQIIEFLKQNESQLKIASLINLMNNEGETSLHLACEIEKKRTHSIFEDIDIVTLLLENGGDIEIITKHTKENPLHFCAAAGNPDILIEVLNFLENKMNFVINKQAKNGWSPLLYACYNGHEQIVEILLKHNARVDVFDEHGMTALHIAAEKGHHNISNILLSYKAFVNARSKLGLTPLHIAAKFGFIELVSTFLIQYNGIIDAISLDRKTPLHLAAQNGQLSVCRYLLENPNSRGNPYAKDAKCQTPLHLAAKNNHSNVVKYFLQYDPDLFIHSSYDGMTCSHIAAYNGNLSTIKEFLKFNKIIVHKLPNKLSGSTTLHLAAEGGYCKIVKLLLDTGADPKLENNSGLTCLHIAAKHGHIEILRHLISKISFDNYSTLTGLTPLHVAAQFGHVEFVRDLLCHIPADIKSADPDLNSNLNVQITEAGLTPLHLAALSGQENMVRLLLNCMDVDYRSVTFENKMTPLHFAAQYGHITVASLFLNRSVSQIFQTDNLGRTALHLSACSGHLDISSLFIGQGANINATDKLGFTPLHYAAKFGHLNICKLLVEGGAFCQMQTKDFKIPLVYAVHYNHLPVISYLITKSQSARELITNNEFVYDMMICSKLNDNKSIDEFILLSIAPIEIAAKLSEKYRTFSVTEKERYKDLIDISEHCELLSADLIALATAESDAKNLLTSVDNEGVQFLDILIKNELKEAICHPMIQQYLTDVWFGELQWPFWKFFLLFFIFLIFPLAWFILFFPIGKKLLQAPVVKFILYLISHSYLNALLLINIFYTNHLTYSRGSMIPTFYEWLLLIFLSGLLVSELINPIDRYSISIVKYPILFLGYIAVIIHCYGFTLSNGSEIQKIIYIRNQFLAAANFFCVVFYLYFLSIHYMFGPLTSVIINLMKDLLRFFVVLIIFILSFVNLISATYQPIKAVDNLTPYDNFLKSIALIYFYLFGQGYPNPPTLPDPSNTPYYSENLSRSYFGMSMIMLNIVFINFLIALMTDTFINIQEESDKEWKNGRSKLIRNLNNTTPFPPPINLLIQLWIYLFRLHLKLNGIPVHNLASKIGKRNTLHRIFLENISYSKVKEVKIEDVVNWSTIAKRYLAIRYSNDNIYT